MGQAQIVAKLMGQGRGAIEGRTDLIAAAEGSQRDDQVIAGDSARPELRVLMQLPRTLSW